jgi:hypothetical protein
VQYRTRTWVHAEIEIGRSPIHGFGMFAGRDFEQGESLSIVGGSVMSDDEFRRFVSTAKSFNAIQIDELLHLVELPEATARSEGSLNHHCDSNLWMLDQVTLAARGPITAGSELTVDYALFTTSGVWLSGPCQCGSRLCRVTPCGTDWRLREVRDRYSGHFSPFLNSRIDSSAAMSDA